MTTISALQQMEYLEAGFEVSKILAQAGYRMDAPAFIITWGQVAEILAQTLADHGLPSDRLCEFRAGLGRDSINGAGDENMLLDLVQSVQKALQNEEVLSWRKIIRLSVTSDPSFMALLEVPDWNTLAQSAEDDEGPLTELYENATRLGDDESGWICGDASTDLFDNF